MPMKTIAVPPNPGARRGGRLAASADPSTDDDVIVSLRPVAPPRIVRSQPAHRYHIGDRLRMTSGGYSVARAGSFCKITALLPYEGRGSLLYRVRSETEQFERVVAEADLSRRLDEA